MLKISEVASRRPTVELRLEGRLVGPWVAETRALCDRLFKEGKRIQLDLAELAYVDGKGLDLLMNLRARGVAFANCSPFMEEQMKRVSVS